MVITYNATRVTWLWFLSGNSKDSRKISNKYYSNTTCIVITLVGSKFKGNKSVLLISKGTHSIFNQPKENIEDFTWYRESDIFNATVF